MKFKVLIQMQKKISLLPESVSNLKTKDAKQCLSLISVSLFLLLDVVFFCFFSVEFDVRFRMIHSR